MKAYYHYANRYLSHFLRIYIYNVHFILMFKTMKFPIGFIKFQDFNTEIYEFN